MDQRIMNHKLLVLFICAAFIFSNGQSYGGREGCKEKCETKKICFTFIYVEKSDFCALVFRYDKKKDDMSQSDPPKLPIEGPVPPKPNMVTIVKTQEKCEAMCKSLSQCVDFAFLYRVNKCELILNNKSPSLSDLPKKPTFPNDPPSNQVSKVETYGKCKEMCDTFSHCVDFTFWNHDKKCELILGNKSPPTSDYTKIPMSLRNRPPDGAPRVETYEDCRTMCNTLAHCMDFAFLDREKSCEMILNNAAPYTPEFPQLTTSLNNRPPNEVTKVETHEKCEETCNSLSHCVDFTFWNRQKNCELLLNDESMPTFNSLKISSKKGSAKIFIKVDKYEHCEASCNAQPKCLRFEYRENNNITDEVFGECKMFYTLNDDSSLGLTTNNEPAIGTPTSYSKWNPVVYQHASTDRECVQKCKALRYCVDIDIEEGYHNCLLTLKTTYIPTDE